MARLRTLADMRDDTRKLADLENALTRFPDAEVNEYVNKGIARVYRHIINVQDRPFYQKDAVFLTTASSLPAMGSVQTTYPLAEDYLQMMSVMWATSNAGPWCPLDPYEESERFQIVNAGYYGAMWPRYYGIVGGTGAFTQGTIPTAYALEILPQPPLNTLITYRYIPSPKRLLVDLDTFDGILGFEDAACTWAAVLMRRKDDLPTAELEQDMARHESDLRMLAKRRDRSRPPRVQLVRNRQGTHGRSRFGFYNR